jgi:hypothetical protein
VSSLAREVGVNGDDLRTRLRGACSEDSTIDLEEHIRHVAETVLEAQSRGVPKVGDFASPYGTRTLYAEVPRPRAPEAA